MLVEAGLVAFSNACFEFADEDPEEVQHSNLASLPKIFASYLHGLSKVDVVGFCTQAPPRLLCIGYVEDRTGYKPLSYGEVLERTGSERIETTIRKRQLGFAGPLVQQGDSGLSKRVMFGRLVVQGPKRGGRSATSWVDCLQKNLEAFGAVPRKGKGRKWVAFGVVVKDGRD